MSAVITRLRDRGTPRIVHKVAPATIRRTTDEGVVVALVSVFDTVDLVGDVVVKGAFTDSIEEWIASGDPVPVILSHQWGDVGAFLGTADPNLMRETSRGLEVTMQFDLDDAEPARVFDLVKRRVIKEWSFAYDVLKQRPGMGKYAEATMLERLDIIEVGPTLKGANPHTETIAVKSATDDAAAARRVAELEAATARMAAERDEERKLREKAQCDLADLRYKVRNGGKDRPRQVKVPASATADDLLTLIDNATKSDDDILLEIKLATLPPVSEEERLRLRIEQATIDAAKAKRDLDRENGERARRIAAGNMTGGKVGR